MKFKRHPWLLLLLILLPLMIQAETISLTELPVAYKGRFRPLEAYARLWLEDISHQQNLPTESALNILWRLHFFGHSTLDDTPLFAIRNRELKNLLSLNLSQTRFSYSQLTNLLFHDTKNNIPLLKRLLIYHYNQKSLSPMNQHKANKLEMSPLAPGLWIALEGQQLVIKSVPLIAPWKALEVGWILQTPFAPAKKDKKLYEDSLALFNSLAQISEEKGSALLDNTAYENAYLELIQHKGSTKEISLSLESQFPLKERLAQAGSSFKMLPSRYKAGEWYSLKALKLKIYDPIQSKLLPVPNFTVYTDLQFESIRSAYLKLEKAMLTKSDSTEPLQEFKKTVEQSYSQIAGTPYQEAFGKNLVYPSKTHLKAETIYYTFPFLEIVISLYILGLLCFSISKGLKNRCLRLSGIVLLIVAFCLHTFILLLRSYILQRPPVSNMFETVIYVPWISVLAGLGLFCIFRNALALTSSACVSIILLIVLKLTGINHNLENVQAVLDSQYWLIIHVLMVVGSYGLFCLAGLLGHFYLIGYIVKGCETAYLKTTARFLQQSLYLGIALLIGGTLLGGVWAAQSWGRFWDWDPKESWAFISACVYLIIVHAYTFQHIAHFGLAIGSIIGLQMISFTWYGVNYILGTGLHSYGFGSGGEFYYYMFLLCETAFILWALTWAYFQNRLQSR